MLWSTFGVCMRPAYLSLPCGSVGFDSRESCFIPVQMANVGGAGAGGEPPAPVAPPWPPSHPVAALSEFTPVPHRGYICLDSLPGERRQVVTHTVTLETIDVQESETPWSIVFDDDGYGELLNDSFDPPGVIVLEERFKFQLWCDSRGLHYIVSGLSLAPTVVQLAAFCEKWMEVQVSLLWGHSRSRHTLMAVYFRWHRFGSRVFISMTSLYEQLGLQQFNGRAWRWTQGCRRWDSWLA